MIGSRNYTRAQIKCLNCGATFEVPHYRRNKAKYCGKSCRSSAVGKMPFNTGSKHWAAANLEGHRHKSASRFPKGHQPWNKDLKGIHLSPASEFKPGQESCRSLPMGAVSIRDDKNGKPRAWVKTDAGWEMRARVVYAAKFGEIPHGKVIHHIDGDTLNDRPHNLSALTRSEHIAEHRLDLRGFANA